MTWKSEDQRRKSMIEKNEAKVLKLQRRIADMCGRLEVMERVVRSTGKIERGKIKF